MKTDLHILSAKAKGIYAGVDRLSKSEREAKPSGAFGRDYNGLLALVAESYPDLKPVLPPEVKVVDNGEKDWTEQTFGESLTYVGQILQLLATKRDMVI